MKFIYTNPEDELEDTSFINSLSQIFSAWGISALVWPPWIIAWPYIEGKRTVPESECEIQAGPILKFVI